MEPELKSPLQMFYHWEAAVPQEVFLRQSLSGDWQELTYTEVGKRARCLAGFLRAQGLQPGDRIALLSSNSADWFIADLAIMLAGCVSVPLYPGQDVESGRYILEHSEAQMILLGAFDQAARVDEMVPDSVTRVALLGCTAPTNYSLAELIESQEPMSESPVPDLDSLMTILYTSGTTGNPKGVMHHHRTPAEVIPRHLAAINYELPDDRERLFSFLPLSHAAERVVIEMRALYNNSIVSFSAGLATFAEELRSVQPHVFFAVPRLWVKFKAGVDAAFPPEVQATFGEAEKQKVRQQLGLDQAKAILTGSAPCPSDVHQWYVDMGIWLREGYSMTENFCDGCFWLSDDEPVPGLVGQALPGVEVKITEDDEICFRSPGLMKGYYRNEEKTNEVLRDGWYHTGDSGRIDEDGNVQITGRISEVFKTSKGKFVVPVRLEDIFGGLDELGQVCIFGHGKDHPLLMTNLSENAQGGSREALSEKLAQSLEQINRELPAHERVGQIFVTDQEWTIENALLTPTMKIKRKALEQRYANWVENNLGSGPVVWV